MRNLCGPQLYKNFAPGDKFSLHVLGKQQHWLLYQNLQKNNKPLHDVLSNIERREEAKAISMGRPNRHETSASYLLTATLGKNFPIRFFSH